MSPGTVLRHNGSEHNGRLCSMVPFTSFQVSASVCGLQCLNILLNGHMHLSTVPLLEGTACHPAPHKVLEWQG